MGTDPTAPHSGDSPPAHGRYHSGKVFQPAVYLMSSGYGNEASGRVRFAQRTDGAVTDQTESASNSWRCRRTRAGWRRCRERRLRQEKNPTV